MVSALNFKNWRKECEGEREAERNDGSLEERCHRHTNKGPDSNRVQESRSGLEGIVEPLRVTIWWDLHVRAIPVTAEKSSAGETRSRRASWILGQPLVGRGFEKHPEGSSQITSRVSTAFYGRIPFRFFPPRVPTSYISSNPLLLPWPRSQRRKTRRKSGARLNHLHYLHWISNRIFKKMNNNSKYSKPHNKPMQRNEHRWRKEIAQCHTAGRRSPGLGTNHHLLYNFYGKSGSWSPKLAIKCAFETGHTMRNS